MTNADQPAYPIIGDGTTKPAFGLTKREYFTAMAMQGVVASGKTHQIEVAEFAIIIADELLRQLETTK